MGRLLNIVTPLSLRERSGIVCSHGGRKGSLHAQGKEYEFDYWTAIAATVTAATGMTASWKAAAEKLNRHVRPQADAKILDVGLRQGAPFVRV